MSRVSLAGVASYLPETIVANDFFPGSPRKGPMFMAPRQRRHVARGEKASEMIERAARRLIDDLNLDAARDIDVILTNVSVPDEAFTGCGAEVAHRIGARPGWILDMHNTGCVSFVYMLGLATTLIRAGKARSAMICNVQNAAGRIFAHPEVRSKPQAAVPGDGCGVGYVVAGGDSPILSLVHRSYGENASDMKIATDDQRKYWEPGSSPLYVDFTEARVAQIISRGNKIVPEVVHEACKAGEVESTDIDTLVTNQPNPIFLRNWREALQLPRERHVDSFERYGNLFGAAIPITLDEAVREGAIKPGSLLALGGFSHAGDYAAATLVRWRAA
jgi:3-oxoacyl-[acyl-carrier-protein] synthase-3